MSSLNTRVKDVLPIRIAMRQVPGRNRLQDPELLYWKLGAKRTDGSESSLYSYILF